MRPYRRLIASNIIINLKTGTALAGALVRQDGQLLFLRNVTLYSVGADPTPVDGEVVVERDHIDFIQRPIVGGSL
ncbi:Uncharacterised protein [Actinomyces bovis]|uniref:Uncharacterized protein n=1 Tax=Actinomyces bovis TaxID=1658 RepID=A0ABY1VNU5_9ACTO|nr:hypothetical protein [Actinomyces bovis]SPT53791.1 Uncharacterised protein [Actinomyces bovis]VEG53144.1 Uncharacterised protein [Actinomyces israelii]